MDKQAVRETVWDAFEERGEARFPFPPHDRIPNFAGADAACDRLTDTDAWASASTLKCNPDAPQLPVRRAALRDGKTVYVAQPRLRDADPFLRIDPADLVDVGSVDSESADVDADGPTVDDATTVSGISTHGTPVAPEDVPHVDLVVAGSVGVTTDGARIGKGEGYSDLEWGVLSELGAVDREAQSASGSEGQSPSGNRASPGDSRAKPDDGATTVATTVHELSVLDGPESPIADPAELPAPDAHDVPLDLVVTPERTIRTETPYARPEGIDWDALDDDKLAAIPVLAERAPGRK
ncbi:5-formyltetrahydrofolate cyclo-ligase [Halorubrum lacusprofundi]|jgi:5-formyltetrahydrofolate cyclo-ligase|uniref:5-formyltetrahydrofolate cyclo-ligase n=1 Tax=Halorubrum lacusprofundi (strain ATCC 49239 / DSM 5036 / JCM 8891 / ACAM 34) TaxID=416348 RepID=B9LNM6_HALLT|nr:5-formyltetrahydrofolate cyclo-ligase [Halorubrum lacusprofundi]ACM56964.1 5-formyltetrahydrofolate cyclo-ligase [Halorubrum lacusprofundi ATCC 49239]MCG1006599.1 5-formyltetrahydrofolate cyclo-ligase [Halorubrum lacusprofundi]